MEGHGDLSYRDIGIQVLLVHLTIHMLVLEEEEEEEEEIY